MSGVMRDHLAHHAAAQDRDIWFRAEVESPLREADDPVVPRIANEHVAADWRRKRAEILKRVD